MNPQIKNLLIKIKAQVDENASCVNETKKIVEHLDTSITDEEKKAAIDKLEKAFHSLIEAANLIYDTILL